MTKQKTITASVNIKEGQQFAVMATLAMGMCLLISNPAAAIDLSGFKLTGISTVLCNAAYLVIFDIGRGLASLAIVAIGIAAMLGKASWGQAMSLGVGIGVVFGSLTMTTTLTTGVSSLLGVSFPVLPCLPAI